MKLLRALRRGRVLLVLVLVSGVIGYGVRLTLLFSLLPSMPTAPLVTGGGPSVAAQYRGRLAAIAAFRNWVNWMNWFFPVGDMLAGATAILVMYVAYLAIRCALNLIRAL